MTATKSLRVLISDALSPKGVEILEKEPGIKVDVLTDLTPEDLCKKIGEYHALVVRSGTKVTREVIEHGKKLQVIGRAGIGLDNVDAEAATASGIIVMNTPGGNTTSTCEHSVSMLCALARNIPQGTASVKQGKWERKKFQGVELYGKTLGVVGLGRIGSEVARRLQAFGMKVVAFDPHLPAERAKAMDIEPVALEDLLKVADFITIHVPLTPETKHLIGEKAFKKMKKGVRIVNCARGGVVDEAALLEALKSEKVAGAALDVFEKEPPEGNPLLKLDNVIATPHLGASTKEAQLGVAVDIAHQVCDALMGRGISNAVNMPSVDGETYRRLKPYLLLGEALGSLQAQLGDSPISEVRIEYAGEMISEDLSPVSIAVLKGVLATSVAEHVNFVNAPHIAKSRGVKVVESKVSEAETFANLISVEVVTSQGRSVVAGSVMAKNQPRIVQVNNHFVEIIPSGYMLLIGNLDKPGIVGAIGTILGKSKINIARMTNTTNRETADGSAITVINVDGEPSAAVLDEIAKVKYVTSVQLIRL
ncbi:MAG: phosphoglycerate dehydrogenase [Candidatus Omnitrophica bacterium]|nr:phosphoglycerate dehydrogenase [Candidatus Omnitrophota bacterium]